MLRIVGLDLSLTSTGFATETCAGTWKPKSRGVERLVELRTHVDALCCDAAAAGEPWASLVVVEDYAFSRAGAHSHELGELGGVVRVLLHDRGIPWVAVNPSLLKSFACGKGNASKEEVLAAAIRKLGYGGSSFDEADAMWLMVMGMASCRNRGVLTDYQRKAVEKITWPELAAAA